MNKELFRKKIENQKDVFNQLIHDLELAVNTYNQNSDNAFSASLANDKELEDWEALNKDYNHKKDKFYIKLDNFWGLNIALTYGLTIVPLEELT